MLGYKAMPGFCVYRVRIRRGGRRRPERKGVVWGKPSNHGINQIKNRKNLQSIAEERVGRVCRNMRVLNSYWVTEDGSSKWFEVILVDPRHKRVQSDPQINWIVRAAQAQRVPRTHIGGKETPRTAQERSSRSRTPTEPTRELDEETAHSAVAIQIRMVTLTVGWMLCCWCASGV